MSEFRKLCKSGGKGVPWRADYARPTRLALVLNMFNARGPAALRWPWAYFHEAALIIPHSSRRNVDWRLLRVARPKKSSPYRDNFERDLARTSLAPTRVPRVRTGQGRAIFVRVRSGGARSPARASTASGPTLCTTFPIAFPQQPAHVPYYTLLQLSGFLHWTLDPGFSQKSIFRIALRLMANITATPTPEAADMGPRPPDTLQTASGTSDEEAGIPALIEALWLTIRENGEAGIYPEARGNSHTTRKS
ncbi:hypothetical protein DL765_004525 [Monosporascus sp. GIB2]|nr:hypothetical protein DL765_004525 [Monosporascus sp. GIB2]